MLSICISCFGSMQGVSFEHSTTILEGVWFCSFGETQMFPCITLTNVYHLSLALISLHEVPPLNITGE